MKKLYAFSWYCGRMGELEGLFVAEEESVKTLIGTEVYFGEVLGKHSDIYGIIEKQDIKERSDDQELIDKLIKVMGNWTISGYNPLDYINNED